MALFWGSARYGPSVNATVFGFLLLAVRIVLEIIRKKVFMQLFFQH